MIKQAVILAGGFGTRISEESDYRPKPMVELLGQPILLHIMKWYAKFGVTEFIILSGYKSDYIKRYFLDFNAVNSDFEIDLGTGEVRYLEGPKYNWKVKVVDTGLNTMTGGRLKRVEKFLHNEFFFTYGDGVGDINLDHLQLSHRRSGAMVSLTRVISPERFGILQLQGDLVAAFEEKPKVYDRWINAGYFIVKKQALELIGDDSTVWENEPLKELARLQILNSYQHTGFWKPMDTLRDKRELENLLRNEEAPWFIK
jgi:glucose-1-phosphate cytidylyltransferase